MIPGVAEKIRQLVAEKRAGKGTAAFVRKELERFYSLEVVHSKDVSDEIIRAMEDFMGPSQSEDDVDNLAYGRETSPWSTSSRALSIQTSDGALSELGIRRKPRPRAVSPKKDPDNPATQEGRIWFQTDCVPVSCCFSTEAANYMGDHVLDYFKERNLLAAEVEDGRVTLQFRIDGDTRSILLEFEIKPSFAYDILLSANWKEHKVRRETTNQQSIAPKSNEGVKRTFRRDRGQGIVAQHRNENNEADRSVGYRNNGALKQMKEKGFESMLHIYYSIVVLFIQYSFEQFS